MKKKMCITVALMLMLIGGLLTSRYTAIGWGNWDDAGSCFSIAFDKHKVKTVDRVVLRVGDTFVEVTDSELIHQLKKELVVAKRTDLRVWYPYYGKYILFYDGDELVRCMRWGGADKDRWVEVYSEDASHMVMFSMGNEGLVRLSEKTADALRSLVYGLE